MNRLDLILQKREIICELARRHKIWRIAVFGSCARREETPESDIDFLVDFEDDSSWVDNLDMEHDLETLFGCKIDLVSRRGLHPLIKDDILNDAIEVVVLEQSI